MIIQLRLVCQKCRVRGILIGNVAIMRRDLGGDMLDLRLSPIASAISPRGFVYAQLFDAWRTIRDGT